MASRKSMDLFGEALLAYTNGDRSTFYLRDAAGKKHVYDLAERFRSYSRLNKLERELIALSRGRILDVGCGTGNVIPALRKRGSVTGIDISPKVIEVANQRGCDNCVVADIFEFAAAEKYDTITLFGNDLGMGGTVPKTRELLRALKDLLREGGQILAITRNYNDADYAEMSLDPIWKGRVGSKFDWIIFRINFLSDLCKEEGLTPEVLATSWKYRLVRITK